MSLPQPEQMLMIDLELPQEAHEYADTIVGRDQDGDEDDEFTIEARGYVYAVMRLVFWVGYRRGRQDTLAKLEREVDECGYIS